MGRTIPSHRMMLEQELKRWEEFKDALRIDERTIFEYLMDDCRRPGSFVYSFRVNCSKQ